MVCLDNGVYERFYGGLLYYGYILVAALYIYDRSLYSYASQPSSALSSSCYRTRSVLPDSAIEPRTTRTLSRDMSILL